MQLSSDSKVRAESEIVAMAFRDDHSAEMVTILNLSFEGCQIASATAFEVGERLRLHMRGQGWIEARVQSLADNVFYAAFNTHCAV